MPRYARVSAEIMRVLREFTPLVEPLSLDEAFLDVTGSRALFGSGLDVARQIKERIRVRVRLTASAGVAPNKFLAKIASDLRKPDGLVEVRPGEESAFLRDLSISRLWGVGPAAEVVLAGLGVRTIGQLARMPRPVLVSRLGAAGVHLLALAHGRDDRPVVPWEQPKSVGAEETFERDTDDAARLRATLLAQADRVAAELRGLGLRGRTVTLKLRFADFRTLTRRDTALTPTADGAEIFRRAWTAFGRIERAQAVRLIGLAVSGLGPDGEPRQLALFGRPERAEGVARAADELNARFGPAAVRRASLLRPPG
jgi:DNA polymerase-4